MPHMRATLFETLSSELLTANFEIIHNAFGECCVDLRGEVRTLLRSSSMCQTLTNTRLSKLQGCTVESSCIFHIFLSFRSVKNSWNAC